MLHTAAANNVKFQQKLLEKEAGIVPWMLEVSNAHLLFFRFCFCASRIASLFESAGNAPPFFQHLLVNIPENTGHVDMAGRIRHALFTTEKTVQEGNVREDNQLKS